MADPFEILILGLGDTQKVTKWICPSIFSEHSKLCLFLGGVFNAIRIFGCADVRIGAWPEYPNALTDFGKAME